MKSLVTFTYIYFFRYLYLFDANGLVYSRLSLSFNFSLCSHTFTSIPWHMRGDPDAIVGVTYFPALKNLSPIAPTFEKGNKNLYLVQRNIAHTWKSFKLSIFIHISFCFRLLLSFRFIIFCLMIGRQRLIFATKKSGIFRCVKWKWKKKLCRIAFHSRMRNFFTFFYSSFLQGHYSDFIRIACEARIAGNERIEQLHVLGFFLFFLFIFWENNDWVWAQSTLRSFLIRSVHECSSPYSKRVNMHRPSLSLSLSLSSLPLSRSNYR